MPADAQMNYGVSSALAQWFSQGKNRADDCDIIEWYNSDLSCSLGREVYKESTQEPLGVIWVSGTKWLGWLLSHWPSILAISVPFMEKDYIQDELSSLFIHVHAPRLFGNALVSMTFIIWQLAG